MSENKVELLSNGIRKALKNYSMYESLAEYIWNGFDAKANIVSINIFANELSGVSSIEVVDNGYGIDLRMLSSKFKPVFESNKAIERTNVQYTSTYHGKKRCWETYIFYFCTSCVMEHNL